MTIPTADIASLTALAMLMILGGIVLWKLLAWDEGRQGRG